MKTAPYLLTAAICVSILSVGCSKAANTQIDQEQSKQIENAEKRKSREEVDQITQTDDIKEHKEPELFTREMAEEAKQIREAILQMAREEAKKSILSSMVDIPGKNWKMGKTEVTQGQWASIMGDYPSFRNRCDEHNLLCKYPVERVSWLDCQEFLKKLNDLPEVKQSGLIFRLPTTSEWKFACEAGSIGFGVFCKLGDGTEITIETVDRVAWRWNNSGGYPHPVGQKEPNAFGLYDMYGNVCEWCQDELGEGEYDEFYYENEYGVEISFKTDEHSRYFIGDDYKTLSNDGWAPPNLRSHLIGFRLCADSTAAGGL